MSCNIVNCNNLEAIQALFEENQRLQQVIAGLAHAIIELDAK
jgi:cell fate (sporulation/competence/biofilm development) regulator YlbF (YheA/YmcA/DUF963 family)